jgi:hypothetical protein
LISFHSRFFIRLLLASDTIFFTSWIPRLSAMSRSQATTPHGTPGSITIADSIHSTASWSPLEH